MRDGGKRGNGDAGMYSVVAVDALHILLRENFELGVGDGVGMLSHAGEKLGQVEAMPWGDVEGSASEDRDYQSTGREERARGWWRKEG